MSLVQELSAQGSGSSNDEVEEERRRNDKIEEEVRMLRDTLQGSSNNVASAEPDGYGKHDNSHSVDDGSLRLTAAAAAPQRPLRRSLTRELQLQPRSQWVWCIQFQPLCNVRGGVRIAGPRWLCHATPWNGSFYLLAAVVPSQPEPVQQQLRYFQSGPFRYKRRGVCSISRRSIGFGYELFHENSGPVVSASYMSQCQSQGQGQSQS
jgi:hypothetical protein